MAVNCFLIFADFLNLAGTLGLLIGSLLTNWSTDESSNPPKSFGLYQYCEDHGEVMKCMDMEYRIDTLVAVQVLINLAISFGIIAMLLAFHYNCKQDNSAKRQLGIIIFLNGLAGVCAVTGCFLYLFRKSDDTYTGRKDSTVSSSYILAHTSSFILLISSGVYHKYNKRLKNQVVSAPQVPEINPTGELRGTTMKRQTTLYVEQSDFDNGQPIIVTFDGMSPATITRLPNDKSNEVLKTAATANITTQGSGGLPDIGTGGTSEEANGVPSIQGTIPQTSKYLEIHIVQISPNQTSADTDETEGSVMKTANNVTSCIGQILELCSNNDSEE